MYLTDIADRDPRQQWSEGGALDVQARAMLRVKNILTRDNPAVFSPDVDARLREEFTGMVTGDSTPPEGWKRSEAPSSEDGKSRHRRRRQRITSN
jgi:hypothetical protein